MTIGALLEYISGRCAGISLTYFGFGKGSSEFNCQEFRGDGTHLAASPHSFMVQKVPLDGSTTAINRMGFDGSNGVVEFIHLR